VVNDPLYNHPVFGPERGKGGNIGKSDEQLIQDLITIHNAENWLGGGSGGSLDDDGSPGLGPIMPSVVQQVPVSAVSTTSGITATSSSTAPTSSSNNRSDTPDSACDVQSLPNSADSPSSNTSSSGMHHLSHLGIIHIVNKARL
jgi:hypothetical protein